MKKTTLLVLFALLLTSVMSIGQTMTFNSGPSEPGFSFSNWNNLTPGAINQNNLASPSTITRTAAGTWNATSIDIGPFTGSNTISVTSNIAGQGPVTFNTSSTQTIDLSVFTGITTLTFTRIAGSGASADYDNLVYTVGTVACDIAVNSITTTAPACAGGTDGTITVNASCTSCTAIQYSLDNVTFQASNTFTRPAGNYTAYVRDTGDSSCNASSMTTIPTASPDTTPPIINCPGNQIENFNASCEFTLPDYTSLVSATDNCPGLQSIVQNPAPGTVITGNTTITMSVVDASGNGNSCMFDVINNDASPPIALCQDITVQLDATGNASITPGDIDAGSTDACGIASLAVSPNTFTCADVGANTVTLTVTDTNGNSSTCTATVTVEDNVPPVALCQDITVQLDAAGNASITTANIDGGSADNCALASLSVSPSSFDCSNLGANTVH